MGSDFEDEEFERPVLDKKRSRNRSRLLHLLPPNALVEDDGAELGPRVGEGGRTEEDGAEGERGEDEIELTLWVERIGVALDLEVDDR